MFRPTLFALLLVSASASAFDFSSLFESFGKSQEEAKALPLPDPYSLHPLWWHYFDDEEELDAKVEKTLDQLKRIFSSLSADDQQSIVYLVSNLTSNLKALPQARKEKEIELAPPKAFNKTYTLEQQLQLNQRRRKILLEIKKDQEEVEELKAKVEATHKELDTRFAVYLRGDTKPTLQRLIAGLDLMAKRTATAISEENLRVLKHEIETDRELLSRLERELEFAVNSFDGSSYSEAKLNQEIAQARRTYENKQLEHLSAEAYAIEVRGKGLQGRGMKDLMSQKSVQSAVEEALAWSQLAFQSLKFNIIMHVNNRFNIKTREMREKLREWKVQFQKIAGQQANWEQLTLLEQERIHKDQGILIAHGESDSNLASLNETRRKVTTETLSQLHLLTEELSNVQWLLDQMDRSIRASSNFLVRWWGDATDSLIKIWLDSVKMFNTSLFKVFEIPISSLTLLRIAFIIFISLATSFAVRLGIKRLGHFYFRKKVSVVNHVDSLAHYFILFIGAIAILTSIGLDFNHILVLLGALTFGIGFGLQSIALNFFSGLKILFERKIKIGDYIELESGRYGKVSEIRLQNTTIRTSDGIEIVVPNSELLNSPLINWTMSDDYRRLHIPFSTAYENDKDLVRTIVSQAAKEVPCAIHNEEYGDPQVWLVKMGDQSLDFELVVWVNYKASSYTDSKEADFLWAIESALRMHEIALPQNQQYIFLKSLPPEEGKLVKN